jgi:nucleotide-binding universal stress UspA family protein
MTAAPIRQIVCAVRGGPESRETVKRAIALALESGAKLTFFHVMDAEFLGYATHGTLRVVYHELREMGEFVMLILCDRARERGVAQVDYILREGNVRTQLRNLAIETGAEVMVIGQPTKSSTKNLFKAAEMDAFVASLQERESLRVIQVEPSPVAEKDLQGGLVL